MSALAAAAAALLAAPAWAAPAPYELYRGGDLGAALGAYRAADDDSSAEAAAELALLLDEAGRSEEAAARWARACALEPGDAFLWNQRGWSALAAGRAGEAAGAFASAVRVSSGAPAAAEAQFGLGLAQKAGGKRPEAIAALQTAAARSSALLPAAATELARLAVELGKPDESIPLYSMALSGDPRQLDALRESAQAYARLGRPREAWGAWRAASELDPGDPETRRGLDEAIHRLPASPEAQLAAARRLLRPLLRPSVPPPPSPQLRVALFAGEDGAPRELRRVLLMPSAAASVEGDDGEPATTLAAGAPWRVSFSTAAGGVEIADHAGRIVRRSARALRVLPAPGASVLIGSAELATGEGVDARDRELRGGLEVAPSSAGLRLVNVLSVEEYLPAAVGQAAPSGTPLEALKALAVVLRSRAEIPQRHPLGAGLCDSRHCRVYLGLAQESNAAARAARLTAGQTLSGRPGTPSAHEACGWATAGGIQDRAAPGPAPASPAQLERLLHGPPDPAHFDGAAERAAGASVRWVLVLRADDLRARMDRVQPVGDIVSVRVAARGENARVLALEVTGSRGTARLEGPRISAFLAPGALRSNLFALRALRRGGELDRLLVWGAGTGDGWGLCLAGSIGQARLGRGYKAILDHYFPAAP